ncbi:hypothetical protein HaLaN_28665, partial [Haematococcus lacustris]
ASISPVYMIVGAVLVALLGISGVLFYQDWQRRKLGLVRRPKKLGAKQAKREKMKQGLRAAGDS